MISDHCQEDKRNSHSLTLKPKRPYFNITPLKLIDIDNNISDPEDSPLKTIAEENYSVTDKKPDINSFLTDFTPLPDITPLKNTKKGPFNIKPVQRNNKENNQFKTPHKIETVAVLRKPVSAVKSRTPFPSKPPLTLPVQSNKKAVPEKTVKSTLPVRPSQFKQLKVNGVEYLMLNILGKGGSSEVFCCFNVATKEQRAIKVVSLNDPQNAKGFVNEVSVLSKLQSCNRIIKMFD